MARELGGLVVAGPEVSNRIWWTLLSMRLSDPEWLGGSTGHAGVSAEARSAGSIPAGGRISAFATYGLWIPVPLDAESATSMRS
jgi:hypothetical protein